MGQFPGSLLLPIYTNLFNIILETGHVPDDWCIGIIQPIYKNKGSKENPDNYRGISLLSCFGKLFTAVINCRLTKFLENRGMLGEEQAGFKGTQRQKI